MSDRPLAVRMSSSTVKLLKRAATLETVEKISQFIEIQAQTRPKHERQYLLDLVANIRRQQWFPID